ncbi:MAG: DUF5329 family protein [Rudaea sp.]
MTRAIRAALGLFLLGGFWLAPALGQQGIEQHKIEYLISAIADLKGARFIRNGHEFDSLRAVEHLRLKLRLSKSHIKTAEDFINRCATASSISGEKYRIRLADGRIVESAVFLRDMLAAYPTQEPKSH